MSEIPAHELPEGQLAFVTSAIYRGAMVTRHGRDLHSVIASVPFTIFGGGTKPIDIRNEVKVKPLPKGTALVIS